MTARSAWTRGGGLERGEQEMEAAGSEVAVEDAAGRHVGNGCCGLAGEALIERGEFVLIVFGRVGRELRGRGGGAAVGDGGGEPVAGRPGDAVDLDERDEAVGGIRDEALDDALLEGFRQISEIEPIVVTERRRGWPR